MSDTALFDLDGFDNTITQHTNEYWWAPIVRIHGLNVADLDLEYYCADTSYGYLERVPARHDAWVWHCCTQKPGHGGDHKCDRCEVTW